MANPRKFSEKIALHNQKQAEETAAFERIMREVSDATSKVCVICSVVFFIDEFLHCLWLFIFPVHLSSSLYSETNPNIVFIDFTRLINTSI